MFADSLPGVLSGGPLLYLGKVLLVLTMFWFIWLSLYSKDSWVL